MKCPRCEEELKFGPPHECSQAATVSDSPEFDGLYCDDCENLHPKEDEETPNRVPHFCNGTLDRRIYHEGQHPHLPRPKECNEYKAI